MFLEVPEGVIGDVISVGCISAVAVSKSGDANYVALRECHEDVMERSKIIGVQRTPTRMAHVKFTCDGLAHYCTEPAGVDTQFATRFHKKTYKGPTDWKTWHFIGDLPLAD